MAMTSLGHVNVPRSFLYKAVNHRVKPGVTLNKKYWKEALCSSRVFLRAFRMQRQFLCYYLSLPRLAFLRS